MKRTVIIASVVLILIGATCWFGSNTLLTPAGIVPGSNYRDPVYQQAQAMTRKNVEGNSNVGWVWFGEELKSIESVRVEGATLQMFILTREAHISSRGDRDYHVLKVYIEQPKEYIDGFSVTVNGETYQLQRAPTSLSERIFGMSPESDDTAMGLRNWSNQWFEIDLSDPVSPRPVSPPDTLAKAKDQEYASWTAPLPYAVGEGEIVSWPSADPDQVIVTSRSELVDAPPKD